MKRGTLSWWGLAAATAAVLAFVYAPIIVSVIFSFSADRFPTLPLGGTSLEWYEFVWSDPDVHAAFWRSATVAAFVAPISVFIGLGAAYTDYRSRFFGKSIYLGLGLMPPLVPILILGVATLFFFSRAGLSGGVYSIVISHVVLCIPFAYAVIRLRLGQVNPALEQAAWNLGAGPWRTMVHVIIPLCRPAIVAALLVTASISFDEFAVAWFVSGLNETLPVRVLNFVQGQASPRINAIGSFTFTVSMVLVMSALALVVLRGASPPRTLITREGGRP
jgi:spermidine/putrescine transport system permease protein